MFIYLCRNSEGSYVTGRRYYGRVSIGKRERARVYKRQSNASSSLKYSRLDNFYVVKCQIGSEERCYSK